MTMTRSWNIECLNPTLSAITRQAADVKGIVEEISQRKDASDRAMFPLPDRVITSSYASLGPMAQTEENNEFYEDAMAQEHRKETPHKKFTIKVVITEEARDDDLFGIVDEMAQRVGESKRLTDNLRWAQLLDNGFNTTYYTGPDGLAIFSESHTAKSNPGLLRTNMLASSVSLGYVGIQNLLTVAHRQKDPNGYPMPMLNEGEINVIYQPEDHWTAIKLFDDRAMYEPETDSNSPNVLKGGNIRFKLVENVFQTGTGTNSTRLWALQSRKDIQFWFCIRKPFATTLYMQDGNKNMVYDARDRNSIHIKDVFDIYGSGN